MGQIGACNVLSDLYAMGVTTCDQMLMILGVSTQMNEEQQNISTKHMIDGFNSTCKSVGAKITGGQTVFNEFPIIGGAASSLIESGSIIWPNNAEPGDVLLLTKPLGTRVITNTQKNLTLPGSNKLVSLDEAFAR
jgi:selenide, water dikinase